MSRRDNDIVPILIDTKNEMKRAIDGLDSRVGDLDRELRTTLRGAIAELRSGPLADLKTSQREIRTIAGNAGRSAGDAAAAVDELRDDVGRLRSGFASLQRDVSELRSLLSTAVAAPVGGPSGWDGPVPVGGATTEVDADARVAHLAVVPAQAAAPPEESLPKAVADAALGGDAEGGGAEPTRVEAADASDDAEPAGRPGGADSDRATADEGHNGDRDVRHAEAADAEPACAADVDHAAATEPDSPDGRSGGAEAGAQADAGTAADGGRDRGGERDPGGAERRQATDRLDRPCWELDGDEPRVFTTGGLQRAILRASKVASATLTCHPDTWEFVTSKTGGHPHFRTPTTTGTESGLVAAHLSGRSLVALLLTLHRVAVTPLETGCDEDLTKRSDWAMAAQVYGTTAEVLRHTLTDGTAPVVITIDNRLHNLP
ncbi:hypothetical protein [Streptomyces spiramenti]|uniref:Uncharacterized protein n=1 Tax=Streptomyces spiramenti TaxID=2720606 RepID=A0ABX1AHR4_9ACTN|nr:hypothetical protein [Streptomyces spiramenti]NJP65461.1 hypothetical protein [Streptomyces spiramenti]